MSIFDMMMGKQPIGGVVGDMGGSQLTGYDPTTAVAPANNAMSMVPQMGGGVFGAVKRMGQPATAGANSSQADALARQHGFPDAATMMAWNQHRQNAITGGSNTIDGGGDGSGGPSLMQNGKWAGPAGGLLNWVSQKIHGATGN